MPTSSADFLLDSFAVAVPLPLAEVPSALNPAAVLLSDVVEVSPLFLVDFRFLLPVSEVVPVLEREELPEVFSELVPRELVPSLEFVVRELFVPSVEPVLSVFCRLPVVVVPVVVPVLPLLSFVEVS